MKYTLVYDDGCGPCTRFRNAVEFLDPRRRIEYAGLDEEDGSGRLDSVPVSRRHGSFHLISPEGGVTSGAGALGPLVALIPCGMVLSEAMRVPPVSTVAAFVYSVFTRLHDAGSCSYSRIKPGTPAYSRLGIDLDINVDHSPNRFGLRF